MRRAIVSLAANFAVASTVANTDDSVMTYIALFAAGVLLAVEQRSLLPPFALAFLALLLFAVVLWRQSKPAYWFACFALGFLWLEAQAHWRLQARFPPELHRVELLCEGRVLNPPEISAQRWRFDFRLSRCLIEQQWQVMNHRTRIAWYRPAATQQVPAGGELWQLSVKLKLPRAQLNPTGFDYETWLFQRGIQATGYVRAAEQCKRVSAASDYSMARWRGEIRQRLLPVLPDEASAGVIPALVLADRSYIPADMWQRFRDAGTGHLLAISGLHVGLVAAFAALLGRLLWRIVGLRYGSRALWMGIASLIAATAYAALAGFALPTVRALCMLAVAIAGVLRGYHRSLFDALAFALLVLLVVDPLSVLSAGFWLSFCSVAAIAVGLRAHAHLKNWQQVLWINAVMGLVLAPLSHLLFGQLAWWCSPANLVVVPVFSFVVVPLSLLGTTLAIAELPGAQLLLWCAAQAIEWCDQWQAWLLALPVPDLTLVGWAPLGLLVFSLLLLAPRAWRGASALILAAVVLLSSPRQTDLAPGGFSVTTLDVGHGLALMVETQQHVLLYDMGPSYANGRSSGDGIVAPALRARGWHAPSRLLLSHEDGDHAGGLPALQRLYPDAPLIRGREGGCTVGRKWQWDGVDFELLHPASVWSKDNDNSCVLRVSSAAGSALLPGDVERRAEQRMLDRAVSLKSDLLLVPHHGSKTSSTTSWLSAVRPSIAVISVARDSQWGMPHQPVLERLQGVGSRILSTGDFGAIVVRFAGQGIAPEVVLTREQRRRFWHLP